MMIGFSSLGKTVPIIPCQVCAVHSLKPSFRVSVASILSAAEQAMGHRKWPTTHLNCDQWPMWPIQNCGLFDQQTHDQSTHSAVRYRLFNTLTLTVAIGVQIYSILCQTGLSHHLKFLTSWHSGAQGWAPECQDVKNYKWRLMMLYSCTHMASVGVKGLTRARQPT